MHEQTAHLPSWPTADTAPHKSAEVVVRRRANDRFGAWRRMSVMLDGQHIGRLRRGQAVRAASAPGTHYVAARMGFFKSDPLRVELQPRRETVVSFGVEDLQRDVVVGWRALKRQTRGSWGGRVEGDIDLGSD